MATNQLNLDSGAKFFLAAFQQQSKPISRQVEQKIGQACETNGGKPLSQAQLQQILTDALPDQKSAIDQAGKACAKSGYHCDGKQPNFVTQMVGLHMIEKEEAVAVRPQRTIANRRWTRDPLYAKFIMDNDAQSMLLFNGRDVDDKGAPLLMKAVLRVNDPDNKEEVAKAIEQFKKEMGNFSSFRTHWGEGAAEADIQVVGKTDAYVETKDMHEREFAFGDPLVQVSLDKSGKELSRGVAVNPDNKLIRKYYAADANGQPRLNAPVRSGFNTGNQQDILTGGNLDTTAPAIFDSRIQLSMQAKEDFPAGGWLEAPARHVDTQLFVEPGLIFEPGKEAAVKFANTTLNTAVPKTDAYFCGSGSAEAAVELPANWQNLTLRKLLNQNVSRQVRSTEGDAADAANANIPAWQLIYGEKDNIQIGGQAFAPLSDTNLTKKQLGDDTKVHASLSPITDCDGAKLQITLGEGFLASQNGTSIEGWKVAVGFKDESGKWQQCDEVKVGDKSSSQKMAFDLDTDNLAALAHKGISAEIRVFNANGVPAQRVQVPFTQIPWAESATATQQA